MNNEYKNKPLITNTSTLERREWINTALASVREKLDASTFLPSTLESLGHELGHELGYVATRDSENRQVAGTHRSDKPHLYLAWSADQRRSRP